MKNLRGILVVGEKSIFSNLTQLVAMAEGANKTIAEIMAKSKDEKIVESAMQTIKSLEKEADEIAFRISEGITTGAVSPNVLDNLLESVHIADDIIDTYYYLSRELCRMAKAEFPYSEGVDESEWISLFKSMLDLADNALMKVRKTLSSSDLNEILALRKEIESIEERGDDIKDEGFDWLYRAAPSIHYLQFYHYSELLHKFDDVLDGCEDFSDLTVSIVTSILK